MNDPKEQILLSPLAGKESEAQEVKVLVQSLKPDKQGS